MRIDGKSAAAWLHALSIGLAAAPQALASPEVTFSVDDLGGGLFQYNLRLSNQGGAEPLAGLNILAGNSLFGLDASSVIGAPAGWSYVAPLPFFADDLDFASTGASSDVAIGAELGGFFFQSTFDPAGVRVTGFVVEAIGGDSATQIPLANARFVPEPTTTLLVGATLLGWLGAARRRPADGSGAVERSL